MFIPQRCAVVKVPPKNSELVHFPGEPTQFSMDGLLRIKRSLTEVLIHVTTPINFLIKHLVCNQVIILITIYTTYC